MPLMDHLRELRSRIFKALIAVLIASAVSWVYYREIFDVLVGPIEKAAESLAAKGIEVDLILSGVTAAFMLQVKVSLLAGFILASPVWI